MPRKGPKPAKGGQSEHGMDVGGSSPGRGRPESPGRSDSSPGHVKKEAGVTSAEEFAPGHTGERHFNEPDSGGELPERR